MSTHTDIRPAVTIDRPVSEVSASGRARRRAVRMFVGISVASVAMTGYLLLAGHTVGEQAWGPATTAAAAVAGGLSLVHLVTRGRHRGARLALIGLWLAIAFLGFGGYQSHRLAFTGADPAGGGPPIAPLVYVGFGIAGAVSLRAASKGQ